MSSLESRLNKVAFDIVESINRIQDKNKKKKLFNLIDKSLGVLANDGVYAYCVYIMSQKSKEESEEVEIFLDKFEEIFNIVSSNDSDDNNFDSEPGNRLKYSTDNRIAYFQKVAGDLSRLLFLKDLMERILIYARYHAKAMGDSE
jgi:hypothetical protein